jgi:uncharacterized membrane protein YbhN (UPF0104 family)
VLFLAVPPLLQLPPRFIEGCAGWIVLAVLLELLSVLGFTVLFKLVFGAGMSRRQGFVAGLRAIGASTVLPAGGLVGPVIGARSTGRSDRTIGALTRSAVAFAVITNLPGVLVLGALGLSLWLGWPAGPHDTTLTLLAAGVALVVLLGGWLMRGTLVLEGPPGRRHALSAQSRLAAVVNLMRGGLAEANLLLSARNWKLAGAVGYFAFDNAVLWAAFRAHGWAPPVSVIVMGYLVGSLGTALPLPAGIGAVEGGLIGALVLYGVPAAPAAGAVLLYRGVSLLIPVVVSACAWALRPGARVPVRALRGSKPGTLVTESG